ncbi:hypothetical protein ACHAXH_001973, partial [Discostella pseudostelligera]
MRMGRPTKPRKPSSRKHKSSDSPPTNRPKFSSPTLIVGQISSNLIESIYAPTLYELAVASVEKYADALLEYEEQMRLASIGMAGSDADATADVDEDDDAEDAEDADMNQSVKGKEAELDLDGSIIVEKNSVNIKNVDIPLTSPPPPPPPPSSHRLFTTQHDIDELSTLLRETSSHFSTPSNSWKVHANAAKFERLLDEKYGKFRPFIESHPNVELFIKTIQRKYAMGAFSPLRKGDSPINKTTAIMVLFMMHRNNVRWQALVLVATFCLVGLQPWALVTLVAVGKMEMERRKGRRVHGMPKKLKVCEPYYARGTEVAKDFTEEDEEEERAKKYAVLAKPVGTKFNPADLSLRDEKYDVLLIGSGVETLYPAALLARAGRKVCVLSPMEDVSECVVMEKKVTKDGGMLFANVPFDIKGTNIAHLSKQQTMLAPALVTNTDTQGGIRFARIGSPCDGYAHSILSVPGLGTDKITTEPIPIVINAEGPLALAEYCANYLGDGFPCIDSEGNDDGNNSTSLGYIKACQQINAGSGDYYLSKLFASTDSSESNVYQQASIRPVSAFLNKCLPLNTHVRSLMAAIGMPNENLSPDNTSMAAHVSHLCAMLSEEGMAYPIGGPRALCHALTSVIEQCDGRVVSGISLQELLFEKLPAMPTKENEAKDHEEKKQEGSETAASASSTETNSGPKPRCRGVRLQNGCEITVSDGGGAVLSTLGFIPTFLHLLPSDIRTAHGVPSGLPAVSERRPIMKVLVGLKGTKEELDLTGADWYRLPNATLPRDELDPLTGQVKFGTIGVDESHDEVGRVQTDGDGAIEGETLELSTSQGQSGRRKKHDTASTSASSSIAKKSHRSKFTSGESWMKISFPSAKDPSWQDRYGSVSTCVITIEADDDFVRMFDTKPKIYSILKQGSSPSSPGEMERLGDRVLKDLVDTFPQLEGNINDVEIRGPYRSGLVQNPARYAIRGNRPEMPYPGLFIGGADLTVADSTSGAIVGGWLAANAIFGYSLVDQLYLKKNITSDLNRFLEEPSLVTQRN